MADMDTTNIDTDYSLVYQQYSPPLVSTTTNVFAGDVTTVVTTINGGGGGQATGPTITLSGGSTGLNFIASANSITLSGTLAVANGGTGGTTAAAARTNLGAAASGVNTDITQLNGASQVDVSSHYEVAGVQVVQAQGAAVPDAAGGATIDAEARTAINDLLARLRAHGLIAT